MTPRETVKAIFEEEFGEENVDFQKNHGIFLIRFPEVTITNEYNESIDIKNLYAKIQVTPSGRWSGDLTMLKSTYTKAQWLAGYRHSHLRRIYEPSQIKDWGVPCLGTGPINRTITSLRNHYSEELWGLFAYELSKYVTVESVEGVPYIRLSNVTNQGNSSRELVKYNFDIYPNFDPNPRDLVIPEVSMYNNATSDNIALFYIYFIRHYLKNTHFKFNIEDNVIGLGVSDRDFVMDLSSKLIAYLNNTPDVSSINTDSVLRQVIETDGIICFYENTRSNTNLSIEDMHRLNNTSLDFTFKGEDVLLTFIYTETPQEESESAYYLVTKNFASLVKGIILKLVNYGYKERGQIRNYVSDNSQNTDSGKFYFV